MTHQADSGVAYSQRVTRTPRAVDVAAWRLPHCLQEAGSPPLLRELFAPSVGGLVLPTSFAMSPKAAETGHACT